MRKKMVSAVFVLVTFAADVFAADSNTSLSRKEEILKSGTLEMYTKLVSDDPEVPLFNPNYKQRLDSIQKSVPLTYNKYVHNYISIYVARPAQIGRMVGLSKFYFPIYEKIFKENGLPDELKFLSIVESALDPFAVSRSGATGLWQFMYTTAKGYRLTIDNYVDDRRDPIASTSAAARYFKESYLEFGDWLLAIAAYNCGRGAVSRAIEKAGGLKDFWAIRQFLPQETQNYVPAFIAITYMMNCYSQHDISTIPSLLPELTDVIQVNRFVSLSSVAKAAEIGLEQVEVLNPSYKKQIINGTPTNPKSLVLPVLDKQIYFNLYSALNSTNEEPRIISASNTRSVTADPVYHRVKSGESLSTIANRYRVEVQDIRVWNRLKSSLIVPGQRLKVSSGKSL
jgi:membrane-bound lytic murein transglycosylase D